MKHISFTGTVNEKDNEIFIPPHICLLFSLVAKDQMKKNHGRGNMTKSHED